MARRADFDAGRSRFLDAADKVYVAQGYSGASIRAITKEAGTSLARLNRHWEGKQHLFRDVFARHFDAIHARQSERLDRIDLSAYRGGALVGEIIDAFFAPAFGTTDADSTLAMSRLVYCRAMTDAAPDVRELVEALVSPMRERLLTMLRMSLPDSDKTTLFMVFSAIFGAYIYPQLFGRELAESLDMELHSLEWDKGFKVLANLFRRGLS